MAFQSRIALRFQEVKSKLRVIHRMTIRKRDGEYRVNFIGGTEADAYYTDDLQDAYATGIDMRLRRDGVPTTATKH